MYHISAAKGQAHFIDREPGDVGNVAGEACALRQSVCCGVAGSQDYCRATFVHKIAHLIESRDNRTGAPQQAQQLQRILRQRAPGALDEVGRHPHRAFRAACEGATCNRLLQQVPLCANPDAASGKTLGDVRHDPAIGIDRESNQPRRRIGFAGDNAATLQFVFEPAQVAPSTAGCCSSGNQ